MKKFNICATTTYNYHFTTSIYADNFFHAYRIATKWSKSQGHQAIHRIYVDEVKIIQPVIFLQTAQERVICNNGLSAFSFN